MRTGKLANISVAVGWNLLYTVPKGEHGVVNIHLVSSTGAPATFQIRHVIQGNGGTGVAHSALHDITSPYVLSTDVYTIKDLGVGSLDDIWVSASLGGLLVASVNTEGKEYKHGASQ